MASVMKVLAIFVLLSVGAVAFRVDASGKNEMGDSTVTATDPAERVFADLPTSYSAWKERGNAHFASGGFSDALMCYRAALSDAALGSARREIATLLSNRALCRFKIGDFGAAVTFAGAALQLDRNNTNAAIRLKQAWSRLAEELRPPDGHESPAAWCRCAGVILWEQLANADVNKDSAALKDDGKVAFEAGRFEEADKLYASAKARHASLQNVVIAFTNAAACCLELKDFANALEFSTAAVVLDPSNAKAWVRRSKALEGMQDPLVESSLDGVRLQPVLSEAKLLKERLRRRSRAEMVSQLSTEQQRRERDRLGERLRQASPHASSDAVGMFAGMLESLPPSVKQRMREQFGPLVDRTVPKFHDDFPEERGWPATDVGLQEQYREHLRSAYVHATQHPWLMEFALKSGAYEFSEADLYKRYGGLAGLAWMEDHGKDITIGGIIGGMSWTDKYEHRARTNFCNRAPTGEILHKGTTHIAVGFNDLSAFLACTLRDAPPGRSGPLRFVGIDMSAFSVAKALVVAEMFRRQAVPLLHCMQVWFSSSWSSSALASFRSAARDVVSGGKPDSQVKAYLDHWLSSRPVSLLEARRLWLASQDGASSCIVADMKHHADRMALSAYLLTGDLGVGVYNETPAVGSLTMFSVPAGAPPNVREESAFNAVSFQTLAAFRKERGIDIVAALRGLLLERFARLRNWLVAGNVTIDLRCGELTLENEVLRQEVADMRPSTMSWSNVLDYMLPTHFHALARACSLHGDTVHSGYSMNWPSKVHGTCIIDYMGQTGDLSPGALIRKTHLMLRLYGQRVPEVSELIVLPPFGTPMNTVGYFLAAGLYKHWVKYFFAVAEAQGPVQVGEAIFSEFSTLSQESNSVAMSWTYDPNINLVPTAS